VLSDSTTRELPWNRSNAICRFQKIRPSERQSVHSPTTYQVFTSRHHELIFQKMSHSQPTFASIGRINIAASFYFHSFPLLPSTAHMASRKGFPGLVAAPCRRPHREAGCSRGRPVTHHPLTSRPAHKTAIVGSPRRQSAKPFSS
jgi:hypothetical protein